jgi:hypothetical protein
MMNSVYSIVQTLRFVDEQLWYWGSGGGVHGTNKLKGKKKKKKKKQGL